MAKGYRSERLAEEIRKIVSELLYRELKDPRFSGLVSISAVEATRDLSYATIYVSILEEDNQEEVLKAFESAKGLIRKEIGRKIKTRHVPELIFKLDNSQEYSRRISAILDGLQEEKDE